MRHLTARLRVAALCAAIAITATLSQPAEAGPSASYIVVLRGDADVAAVVGEHGRRWGLLATQVYEHALRGYAARIPLNLVELLRADPRVAFVEEDSVVQAFDEVPTGVNRIEADVSSTLAGNGSGSVTTAVAVIDTGIATHSELNKVGGKNCTSSSSSTNDGNGHGTHVAGTIAARDNGSGIVGVAPGAPLYAVKVLNSNGSGFISWIVCGINWVAANGPGTSRNIKVANMSLGGTGADDGNCGNSNNDSMHKAICNAVAKGVTFVVAAGNSNVDLKGFAPAAYDEVLTVTAMADFNGQPGGGAAATCRTDVDETPADFSNFATLASDQAHTIAGPGVCIKSTWLSGGYNTISGTSMASPHVAGVVALCIYSGGCAGLTPAQITAKLRADAAARPASYGFTGDASSTAGGKYYGHLIYAGGY